MTNARLTDLAPYQNVTAQWQGLGMTTNCFPNTYGQLCYQPYTSCTTTVLVPGSLAEVERLLRDAKTEWLITLAEKLKPELEKRHAESTGHAERIRKVLDEK